jgi:Domain of unknown function (DUF4384)
MNMSRRGLARVVYFVAVLAGCSRSTSPVVVAPVAGDGGPSPSAKFTLDVTPSLKGSRNTVLRSGDKVVTGDGINVAVKASTAAHLYVGYCDRDRKLTIFPPVGSIEVKVGEVAYMPAKGADIILDDQIGPEVLYVIGSRRRLDVADPDLAAAISKVRPGAANVECGEALDQVLGSRGPDQITEEPGPAPDPAAGAPAIDRASSPAGARRKRSVPAKPDDDEEDRLPPPAKLERGGYIRWGATGEVSADGDRDEIVVLRYTFTHVDR